MARDVGDFVTRIRVDPIRDSHELRQTGNFTRQVFLQILEAHQHHVRKIAEFPRLAMVLVDIAVVEKPRVIIPMIRLGKVVDSSKMLNPRSIRDFGLKKVEFAAEHIERITEHEDILRFVTVQLRGK